MGMAKEEESWPEMPDFVEVPLPLEDLDLLALKTNEKIS